MNEDYHPTFRVRFRMLTSEEGGRHTPIHNGYRPQWNIVRNDGTHGHHDAMFQSLAKDPLLPGEETEAEIEPFYPHFWKAVRPGMTVGIFEGARQVGEAEVLAIPTDLPEKVTGPIWRLLRKGGPVLAELEVNGGDGPWLHARCQPTAAFDDVRELFEVDAALLERIDNEGGVEAWEEAYRRIREAVSLSAPDGHPVAEFILHIDDDGARWRWTDEPFEELP